MYDDILVPTDGSEGTSRVLKHAVSIASDNEATIHGLYVVDRRLYLAASKETKDDVIGELEAEGQKALATLREQVEAAGLVCRTERREGIPHKAIATYVDDVGVDLIVMGTHGRTGPERVASLGSTTDRVVEGSAVPVLVVRMG